MTPHDDLATLRASITRIVVAEDGIPSIVVGQASEDADAALSRVEAELARLEAERDEARKGQLFANDALMRIERDLERCRERHTEDHDRVAQLEQGLRRFDAKWYPTLAGRAISEASAHHTEAAALWNELCDDFRSVANLGPARSLLADNQESGE